MIYTSSYDELVIHLSLTHSLWTAWSCSMWVIEWVNLYVLFVFLTDWLIASCLHDCSLVSVDCKVVNTKKLRAHSSNYHHAHTDTQHRYPLLQLLLLLLLVHELLVDDILAALLQLARSFFSACSYCLSFSTAPGWSLCMSNVHLPQLLGEATWLMNHRAHFALQGELLLYKYIYTIISYIYTHW
jgi:hypothetical protein